MSEEGTVTEGEGIVVTDPGPAPAPTWTSSLGDELKGYVETKGFSDPKALAESYRNLEKLTGGDQTKIARRPERMFDDNGALTPEGRTFREWLGAPKEVKDYALEIPEDYGGQARAEQEATLFHKYGVDADAAKAIVKERLALEASQYEENRVASEHRINQEEASLKSAWGAAYEQNTKIADQAAATLGISEEVLTALGVSLGPAEAMKQLLDLGKKLGEATFVEGGSSGGELLSTPEQAQSEIKSLMGDANFYKKMQMGDADAIAKWNRLHQAAAPGSITI